MRHSLGTAPAQAKPEQRRLPLRPERQECWLEVSGSEAWAEDGRVFVVLASDLPELTTGLQPPAVKMDNASNGDDSNDVIPTCQRAWRTVLLCKSKFSVLGSLYLGNYCNFVCATLFPAIKLIELYSQKQSCTYKSMTD